MAKRADETFNQINNFNSQSLESAHMVNRALKSFPYLHKLPLKLIYNDELIRDLKRVIGEKLLSGDREPTEKPQRRSQEPDER